mmetsp:Transcript_27327/g.31242  ORF Transcript_27327/g.31242 Transcript_27327/m.31242 type:complete len:545 (-) Transcript_27327:49-1683(-)
MTSGTLLTIIVTMLATQVSHVVATGCTLCEGTDTLIFPENIVFGEKDCQELSMDALWYLVDDPACSQIRELARTTCGCVTDAPTGSPTNAPTNSPISSSVISTPDVVTNPCYICPGDDDIPANFLSKTADNDKTCQELALDALLHEATSTQCLNYYQAIGTFHCGCSSTGTSVTETDAPTQSPTIFQQDQGPDCQALMAGNYRFFSSFMVKTVVLNYNMDVILKNNFVLDDVVDEFEDVASRIVSAGAAGCFDRRILQDQKSLRKVQALTTNEVHYVKFKGMTARDDETSCTVSSGGSTCIPSEGRIEVTYSPMPDSRIRGRMLEGIEWAEKMVKEILNEKQGSIIAAVPGVHDANIQMQNDAINDVQPTRTKGINQNVIIGCSCGGLFAAGLAFFLCKKKRNGGLKRRFSKEVERVNIVSNRYGQSDDPYAYDVEYVPDGGMIFEGDCSVSNAPTVEYKKVTSLESTIITKTHSEEDSDERDISSDDSSDDDYPLEEFDNASVETPFDETPHSINASISISSSRFVSEYGEQIAERSYSTVDM